MVKSYKSRAITKEKADPNLKFANLDVFDEQTNNDVKESTGRVKSFALNRRLLN